MAAFVPFQVRDHLRQRFIEQWLTNAVQDRPFDTRELTDNSQEIVVAKYIPRFQVHESNRTDLTQQVTGVGDLDVHTAWLFWHHDRARFHNSFQVSSFTNEGNRLHSNLFLPSLLSKRPPGAELCSSAALKTHRTGRLSVAQLSHSLPR